MDINAITVKIQCVLNAYVMEIFYLRTVHNCLLQFTFCSKDNWILENRAFHLRARIAYLFLIFVKHFSTVRSSLHNISSTLLKFSTVYLKKNTLKCCKASKKTQRKNLYAPTA